MSDARPLASGPGGPHRAGSRVRSLPRGFSRITFAGGKRRGAARLTVPVALARLIGTERLFRVELTDEGVLFRYVEGGEPVGLPILEGVAFSDVLECVTAFEGDER